MVNILKIEMGDVLWYLAVLCTELNIDMNDVAENKLNKLSLQEA